MVILQSLSVVHQVLIAVAIALSPNSIRNYTIHFIGFLTSRGVNQNSSGRFCDWAWLSLVIYLLIALA